MLGQYDLGITMFSAAPPTQSMSTKNLSKPEGGDLHSTQLKKNHLFLQKLISCASLRFRKRASTQSKWVKLKTGSTVFRQKQTHVEPMSETVRQFIFLSQKRKQLRQNLLRSHKWELIFAALLIFWAKILEYSCRLSIWQFFFHLIVNDTLKQQTTALEAAIFFLMQTCILWWNRVAVFFFFFYKWKNGFTKMFSADSNTILYLPHSTSSIWQSVSVSYP